MREVSEKLSVNRFGCLTYTRIVKSRTYERLFNYKIEHEQKLIIEGLDGPDPKVHSMINIAIGIGCDILDINKYIGYIALSND